MHIYPRPPAIKVISLLAACSLPNADVSAKKLEHFFGCGTEMNPSGVVGVELYGDFALLRSLAVAKSVRGQGCGTRLVKQVEAYAQSRGVKRLYLLTTTAESFFDSLGYERVDRETVPESIRATTEFSGLCPTTAAVMVKAL